MDFIGIPAGDLIKNTDATFNPGIMFCKTGVIEIFYKVFMILPLGEHLGLPTMLAKFAR